MKPLDIGFARALTIALKHADPIGTETLSVMDSAGMICAEKVAAKVDAPSLDASLRDGYAVASDDIANAGPISPVELEISGNAVAGEDRIRRLPFGKTIRVLTGATVPKGADLILEEEVVKQKNGRIQVFSGARAGKNILVKGSDVARGEILATSGQEMSPGRIGFLVAGGISRLRVFKRPKIGLLAIGSELFQPGKSLPRGKLYASNVALQHAWCKSMGFETDVQIAEDSPSAISARVKKMLAGTDLLITSGGAWKGDRDFVIKVFTDLGWKLLFHRVRMLPGKAIGMGIIGRKPIFCLSGGPTANEIAFMMIALPFIHRMAGVKKSTHLYLDAKLEKTIKGARDWTQFVHCRVIRSDSETFLRPINLKSRLSSIASAQTIIQIPEGIEEIPAGSVVSSIRLDRLLG
ncbi:MAG: molybdopterin molybdotransferase MoeA [Desulfobacterales bacterium]